MSLLKIWEKAQSSIRSKIGETSHETWFSSLNVKEQDLDTLIIETPDEFFKNWIIEHYLIFIEEALNEQTPKNINLEFEVNSTILGAKTQKKFSELEKD